MHTGDIFQATIQSLCPSHIDIEQHAGDVTSSQVDGHSGCAQEAKKGNDK